MADLVARFQPELEANCRSHKNPTRSGAVAAEFFGSKPVSQIKPRPAFASASTVAKGRSGPKNTYVLLREALYEMDQAKEQMRVAQARLDAATHRLLEVLQKSESKGATKSH
ncbi:hypothetical protein JST97_25550 [bacterium]|nr:hypothetical protein [bacterium]